MDLPGITQKLLLYCKPNEIEIEARFRGSIITPESVNKLLNHPNLEWTKHIFTERRVTSETNRTSSYRQRDKEVICKSFIYKKDFHDLWSTINVSTEKNIPSMSNKLQQINPITATRYRCIFNQHYIDITYDNRNELPRLELEVIDTATFDLDTTIHTIQQICKMLQNSSYFLGQYMWKTIYHLETQRIGPFCVLEGRYQKPITMTMKELSYIQHSIDKWAVTAKIDGVRNFIIIYENTIYTSSIQGNIQIFDKINESVDQPLILDAEYMKSENIFYIFDIAVYKGEYCGKCSFQHRMDLLNNIKTSILKDQNNIIIKDYYTFDSYKQLKQIYTNIVNSYTIDGLIFVNTQQGYIQSPPKWKIYTTVDLQIIVEDNKRKLITCDNMNINISWEDLYPTEIGIWEFKYEQNTLIPIRKRDDKPQANSKNIVMKNIRAAVPGTIFTGVGCYLMRKYHNNVKATLLRQANTTNAVLLDIGTGQGGDYSKWLDLHKIYCIEPSLTALQEMKQRIGTDSRITILNKNIKDANITDIHHKIDIFTAFFCTNLFTKEDWSQFIKLIKNKGSKKCRVLLTALTRPKAQSNKVFSLQMTGIDKYNISLYDTRIMNIEESIVKTHELTLKMNSCGLTKVLEEPLDQNTFLSEDEHKLSSMYTQIVYKKKYF